MIFNLPRDLLLHVPLFLFTVMLPMIIRLDLEILDAIYSLVLAIIA